ncbi:MAG: hypothetical protein ABSC93_12135 [Bryobacteraceae bacterium]|jgi:hypothetical protein
MINNVQSAINAILGSVATLRSASGAGRIFELFIMTGVANGLQNRGFEVWLQRSDGSRISPSDPDRRFFQRGGAPTGVPSASLGPQNASVIGFRRASGAAEWEIWNGIQFQGRSGANDEIDIAVVPREVGIQLRQSGGLPSGRPRVAIECKDAGQAGSVDEMRAFVARLYDLTMLRWHQPYLPFPAPLQAIYPGNFGAAPFYAARATYRQENQGTFNAIARRTGFAFGAAAMTNYYAIEPHSFITAGSNQAASLMDAVAEWIDKELP